MAGRCAPRPTSSPPIGTARAENPHLTAVDSFRAPTFLHEAAAGRDRGKTRPARPVAATDPAVRPRYAVLLPITHTRPMGDTVGIEIPARVRQALGLDDAPRWAIVSEHNVDEWPNAGLSCGMKSNVITLIFGTAR